MNRYSVRLVWREPRLPFRPDACHDWCGVVVARNVDEAIRHAKAEAKAPERAAHETQRLPY